MILNQLLLGSFLESSKSAPRLGVLREKILAGKQAIVAYQ